MKKLIQGLTVVSMMALFTVSAFAAGGHDRGCTECHDPHVAVGPKLMKNPSGTDVSPSTGNAITVPSSLCMGCHSPDAGMAPEIDLKTTHPVGMKIQKVNVPSEIKAMYNDELHCPSCHDFHPANDGAYKYLRFGTEGADAIGTFCQGCHDDKGYTGI